MLHRFFERETIDIRLEEPTIQLKNDYLLKLLRSELSLDVAQANHCSEPRRHCPHPSGQTILTLSAT
jgi:hypothetical protein